MKVSIITVSFNSCGTIEETIRSVASQDFNDLEHVVVDGGSSDGTREILEKHKDKFSQFISEPDRGIYDAMNKGVKLCRGDLIGFLNADDLFAYNGVVSEVAEAASSTGVAAVYGDLVYIDANNSSRMLRYYDSRIFNPHRISRGIMPAHPTLYLKREIFTRFGLFKANYKIAGDFEHVARVFSKGIGYRHIPKVLVKMRKGGVSTRNLKSNWFLNLEMLRACKENGIATNWVKIYSKYPIKLLGLIHPKYSLNPQL